MTEPTTPRKSGKVRLPYGGLCRLAALVGVTPSHLSHYFAGKRESNRLDAKLEALFGATKEDIAPSHTIAEAGDDAIDLETLELEPVEVAA